MSLIYLITLWGRIWMAKRLDSISVTFGVYASWSSLYLTTKWPSLWKIQVNNPSFNNSAVGSQYLLRLFAVLSIRLFISSSLSRDSTLLLCLLYLCLSFSPRHNFRRRSLFMRVLSHSDTHHLNRHMVGCGCHEILIPCSTTVLFSTTFLLISISRIEGDDEVEFISVV